MTGTVRHLRTARPRGSKRAPDPELAHSLLAGLRADFPAYEITARDAGRFTMYDAIARHPGMSPVQATAGSAGGLRDMLGESPGAPAITTVIPASARVYDYVLGGRNNFAIDRMVAETVIAAWPEVRDLAVANKQFITRAVRHVEALGVRQFVDLGAGLPVFPPGATRAWEPPHMTAPGSHVAYVDHDPMVVTHIRALLTGDTPDADAFLADIRDPDAIWAHPGIRELIDFTRPVCLIFGAVLHYLPAEQALKVSREYAAQLPPGSYVIFSVGNFCTTAGQAIMTVYNSGETMDGPQVHAMTAEQVAGLFPGLTLMPPGITKVRRWRPGWQDQALTEEAPAVYAAVMHRS